MLVLALSVAIISPALGGPSVLTLGKARKVFVTKKKAKKTYLTGSAADARYVRPSGETRVPIAPSSWVLTSSPSNTLMAPHFADAALVRNTVGSADIYGPAPTVNQLYGTGLKVSGLEVCYRMANSSFTNPILDRIAVQRVAGSDASPVPSTLEDLYVDETGRVDDACTKLKFTPIALQPNDSVGVGLRFDFKTANTQIRVGRASLILSP